MTAKEREAFDAMLVVLSDCEDWLSSARTMTKTQRIDLLTVVRAALAKAEALEVTHE